MTNLRTRSKTNLWLVGPSTSENILGAGLPTNRAVFSFFFNKNKGYTVKNSAKHTVQKVFSFWGKAKIQRKEKIRAKMS